LVPYCIGDVWSFGIVLWEIFSMGLMPYAGLSNNEVLGRIVMGYRLPCPADCPKVAYNIMQRCWSATRPSFESLEQSLLFLARGGSAGEVPELQPFTTDRSKKAPSDYVVLRINDLNDAMANASTSDQSSITQGKSDAAREETVSLRTVEPVPVMLLSQPAAPQRHDSFKNDPALDVRASDAAPHTSEV
jgi:hypothetical protein